MRQGLRRASLTPTSKPLNACGWDGLDMHRVIISGIGVEIPEPEISNEELVASFNSWVDTENARRSGTDQPLLQKSDSDFIVHASGVRSRHVIEREGILDPTRMAPRIPAR